MDETGHIVGDCPCHPPAEVEPVDEKLRMVAVRVDPETGFLYAPVVQANVDAIDAVLFFLDSVDATEVESASLTDYPDLSPGEGILNVLRDRVNRARS